MRVWPVLAAALAWTLPVPAGAVEMFKCGTTFQDRPCADQEVQKRFSRTAGEFTIEQVNPDTDKDCAQAARNAMPYWERLAKGENLEALLAEFERQRVSRYEKSQMRDALIALREVKGTPLAVRSQFETQCMAYKMRRGLPTERKVAATGPASADILRQAEVERRRQELQLRLARDAELRASRAAAEAAEAAARARTR